MGLGSTMRPALSRVSREFINGILACQMVFTNAISKVQGEERLPLFATATSQERSWKKKSGCCVRNDELEWWQ